MLSRIGPRARFEFAFGNGPASRSVDVTIPLIVPPEADAIELVLATVFTPPGGPAIVDQVRLVTIGGAIFETLHIPPITLVDGEPIRLASFMLRAA